MNDEIERAILSLVNRCFGADAIDVLPLTQSALNLAHVALSVQNIKMTKAAECPQTPS